jgi:alanine dehydrogenase
MLEEKPMLIGVPKEIKNHEYRVGLIPSSVAELVRHGHKVLIETGAGSGSGVTDQEFETAGATIARGADDVWSASEMVIKVKEPLAAERKKLNKGQVLFTYLHLAPDAEQTHDLIKSGATCIAYETVTAANGSLPLLTPMSEVAGRLAPQVGAAALQKAAGGRGILLGGVPGVAPGEVVILGGGVSGSHAAYIALGMGANVTIVDRSLDVLRRITAQFNGQVRTIMSTQANVEMLAREADLLIGCVLIPGAAAPRLITRAMLKTMKPGSVIVDVAIDQGGCAETSKATTHAEPTYVVDDVVHYCVANMPGAVARTSTFALNNATLPFALALADKGWEGALKHDAHLRAGLNVHAGQVTYRAVAEAHDLPFVAAETILEI